MRKVRAWSVEDLEILRSYIRNTPPVSRCATQCARMLGRTPVSVTKKASRLGLKFRNYTEQEKQAIEQAYRQWDGKDVLLCKSAEGLGRTRGSVSTVGR